MKRRGTEAPALSALASTGALVLLRFFESLRQNGTHERLVPKYRLPVLDYRAEFFMRKAK